MRSCTISIFTTSTARALLYNAIHNLSLLDAEQQSVQAVGALDTSTTQPNDCVLRGSQEGAAIPYGKLRHVIGLVVCVLQCGLTNGRHPGLFVCTISTSVSFLGTTLSDSLSAIPPLVRAIGQSMSTQQTTFFYCPPQCHL